MSRTCLFHISGNQYLPFPAAHHTRRIWDELARDFEEYHIIARSKDNRYIHSVDGSIHLHLLPSFGKRMWPFFFLSWLLPYFILRYKPTHLLAQCPVLGGFSAAICSLFFRIPLLIELHGTQYFLPARPGWKGIVEHILYRWISHVAFFSARRIRSLSEDMSERIMQIYGESVYKKTVVIPNRVDLGIFKYFKETYEIHGAIKIITIGNFSKNKNHCALIEDLSNMGIDFKLTIIGSGSLKEEYLKLSDRLCVRDRIEIMCLDHKSLAALLPQQDIYIHYSLSEGVSRAILEAMAVGLPVVSTRVGFIKGILSNAENAILIDKPYAAGLETAVRSLMTSEETRRHIGISARHLIENHYEWSQVFDSYRAAIKGMR